MGGGGSTEGYASFVNRDKYSWQHIMCRVCYSTSFLHDQLRGYYPMFVIHLSSLNAGSWLENLLSILRHLLFDEKADIH